MSQSPTFLSLNDKPALLGLSSPDWQGAALQALDELGYKVHQAATHGDFIASFTQAPYQVVVIEERFACDDPGENRSLAYLQNLQMHLRRHCVIVLVGDSFTSFHALEAFQCGVHLVVNRSELSLLGQFIQKVVAENDLFYQPFREAQRRAIA